MKKLIKLLFFILLTNSLQAQIFFTESFEATGSYTLGNAGDCSCVIATTDAIDGQNDHFADVTDLDITHNFTGDYIGEVGSRYWASEDNDDGQVGGSGNPTQCVTLTVNIIGRTNLEFSGLFGGHGASNPTPYEADNDMEVSYQIDGNGFTKILDWHENLFQNNISLDTDNDGFGDGTFPLSTTMQTVTALMPGTGTTLLIQICTNSNTSSEEFAFDNIQVGEAVSVPVELVQFTAKQLSSNDVVLDWETASELNNYGFEIESSLDGRNWEVLDFLRGKGTTAELQSYQYIDQQIKPGLNYYYRLKQIDFDGIFEYSDILNVRIEAQQPVLGVRPNPSVGFIELQFNNAQKEKSELRLLDSRGKLIWRKKFEEGETDSFKEDFELLHTGLYYIIYQIGNESFSEKISVIR
jgi:hypothetical protein